MVCVTTCRLQMYIWDHLLLYMRGHCSPYESIHVTLDCLHVHFEVITQMDTYVPCIRQILPLIHPIVATLTASKLSMLPNLLLFKK